MHNPVISKPLAVTFVSLFLLIVFSGSAAGLSYQKMSKEEVRELLDKNDVVIFDVREPKDWESSQQKIKSALRLDLNKTKLSDLKVPKDITLVLY